jgi:hypothetical protein
LEQTVNADAASRKSGITASTASEEGRTRWKVTQSARSAVIGILMDMAGLRRVKDFSQELTNHCAKCDCGDLQKTITGVKNTMVPFSQTCNDINL